MRNKFLLAWLLASCLCLFGSIGFCLPPVEEDGTQSIAAGAQTITLGAVRQHITVWTSVGASNVNISFNPTAATTSDALLPGGAGLGYGLGQSVPATGFIQYYGTGTTGTINWVAW